MSLKKLPQGSAAMPNMFFVGLGTALDNPYRLSNDKPSEQYKLYREWLEKMISEKSPSHLKELNAIAVPLLQGQDAYLVANGHWYEGYVNAIIDIIETQLKKAVK